MSAAQATGNQQAGGAAVVLDGQSYPLVPGSGVQAASLNPWPDAVQLGQATERVSDQRVAAEIFADWRDGMGVIEYDEQAGIASFGDSDCETRYARALVCRPAATVLPSLAPVTIPPLAAPWFVMPGPGGAGAQTFAWYRSKTSFNGFNIYYSDGTAWHATPGVGAGSGPIVPYNGLYVIITGGSNTWRSLTSPSNDGTTWTAQAIQTSGGPAYGLATHDGKLWTFGATANDLYYSLDGSTWTIIGAPVGPSLDGNAGEVVVQLFDWRDRLGKRALYLLTNYNLYHFDDDAVQYELFYPFRDLYGASGLLPHAHVWKGDDNLYLNFYNPAAAGAADTVLQLTGQTINTLAGPNARGGIPQPGRFALTHLQGGIHWLYGWGTTRPGDTAATGTYQGRVLAMNAQGGWHTVYRNLSTNNPVVGGGYAQGAFYTVASSGGVQRMTVPDISDNPINAADLTFDATVVTHVTGWLRGGTPDIPKVARWARLDCRRTDFSPGIPAGASVQLEYQADSGTWVSLGTATSASAFPAIFPFPGGLGGADQSGVAFKRLRFRLTLTRGPGASDTPIVIETSLHFIRRALERYAYTFTVDLRSAQQGGLDGALQAAYDTTLAQKRAALLALAAGNRHVALAYGVAGTPTYVSVAAVDCKVVALEEPPGNTGTYRLTCRDLSAPPQGV